MTPEPRKPTPVRIPWIRRVSGVPDDSASTTIIAAARPPSPSVRNPMGLLCKSRLRPINPPASVAAPRRNTISDQSSNAMTPESVLFRQTSHHIKFVVRAHAGYVGHPVRQREKRRDGGDIPNVVVAETVAGDIAEIVLGDF